MNIELILAGMVLGSIAVNILHWRGHGAGRLLHFPATGPLRALFIVWSIASGVVAALFLASVIPALAFFAVCVCLCIAEQAYSVWSRRRLRKAT